MGNFNISNTFFSFDNMIFGLDLPELHLHPHAQRILYKTIHEKSKEHQFILVSHSPIFIDPYEIEKVIVVKQQMGKCSVGQLHKGMIEPNFKRKLKRHLDITAKEVFFANSVLIVEGPTDKGILSLFSRYLDMDLDRNGISIIEAGGKFSGIIIKILEDFEIQHFVMRDKDALMDIVKGQINFNGKKIKTSAVFHDLETKLNDEELKILETLESEIAPRQVKNKTRSAYPEDSFNKLLNIAIKHNFFILTDTIEGVLKNFGYTKYFDNAENELGDKASKVIVGRYVAEQIIEDQNEIPKEFINVIKSVISSTQNSEKK